MDEKGILNYRLGNRPVVGNQFDSFLFGYYDMSAGLNFVYTNELLKVLLENGLITDLGERNWYMMSLLALQLNVGHMRGKTLYHYRVHSDSTSHKSPLIGGKRMRLFWDDIGQHLYVIEDNKSDYVYKCRAYELFLTNSITDRIATIDDEQLND